MQRALKPTDGQSRPPEATLGPSETRRDGGRGRGNAGDGNFAQGRRKAANGKGDEKQLQGKQGGKKAQGRVRERKVGRGTEGREGLETAGEPGAWAAGGALLARRLALASSPGCAFLRLHKRGWR